MSAVHFGLEAGGRSLTTAPALHVLAKIAAKGPAWAGLIVVVCLLGDALPASAQKDSVLAVGVAASVYRPNDEHVENPWGIGLVARLRRSSGFGATIGLNWFKADVNRDIDGTTTRLGTVIVRPLMGGVAYTRQRARFSISGSLVVGWSFNGLRRTGAATAAYASRLGRPGTTFEIRDCFVYRPSLSLWWELGNRFGLLASVSYIVLKPEIVTRTPGLGTVSGSIDVSSPLFTVGIGYGIF